VTATFDLASQPWIPVLRSDGRPDLVGIREALAAAPEILAVDASSPLVTAALHRLLLAVLHRVIAGPADAEDWDAVWSAGRFDRARLDEYLGAWVDRFDLFGARHPFMQDPQVAAAESKPVAILLPELASERNSALLFDHTIEASLTPAEAACAVLVAQVYAPPGMMTPHPTDPKKSCQAGPLTGTATVFARGRNLFETLCLNLVRYAPADGEPIAGDTTDRPNWERTEPLVPGERAVRGWLDELTWLSRGILLYPATGDEGATVVRRAALTRGEERYRGAAGSRSRTEPTFLAFRANPQAKMETDDPFIPVRFEATRAFWRDSTALFVAADDRSSMRPKVIDWIGRLAREGYGDLPRTRIVPLDSYGLTMAAGRASKPYLWRREHLAVSPAVLGDRAAQDLIARAVRYAEAVGSLLEPRFVREVGVKPVPGPFLVLADELGDRERVTVDPVRVAAPYWSTLDPAFAHFIEALADPDAAARTASFVIWSIAVGSAATAAFRSATRDLERQPRAALAVASADISFRRLFATLRAKHVPEVSV
jgi:CRISPR system Cascade subunit CasA